MNEPDKTEFNRLQKLLASKKEEKPEDGFFDRFSDQVLTRLEEPPPKPSLWERLNDQIDPFRTAATIFSVIIGLVVLYSLEEGNDLAQTKSVPPVEQTKSIPQPLDQSRDELAGSGLPLNKAKTEPPRILMNPGTGLRIQPAKTDRALLLNQSPSNTVHAPK